MTTRPTPRVHRCPGCGRLVLSTDRCRCYGEVVHVVTTLGPDPGLPGVVVPARLMPHDPYRAARAAMDDEIRRKITETLHADWESA